MRLQATDNHEALGSVLRDLLNGHPIEDVKDILHHAKARDVAVVDILASDLPEGTDLGYGIKAGDPLALITFALESGFLQPDLRLQIQVKYDEKISISAIEAIRRLPK